MMDVEELRAYLEAQAADRIVRAEVTPARARNLDGEYVRERHYAEAEKFERWLKALSVLTPQGQADALFEAIKHGDDVHREWLREALTNWFAGEPVPPARSAKDVLTPQAEGLREGLEAIRDDAWAIFDRPTTKAKTLSLRIAKHAGTIIAMLGLGGGDGSAQSKPCADAGAHIPRSPEPNADEPWPAPPEGHEHVLDDDGNATGYYRDIASGEIVTLGDEWDD